MLVAHGPAGQSVIAEETPLEQLQRWSRERALQCPNCRGVVHVRGGPERRMQLHFAHQRGECAWSTEVESVRHARGKMILASWLHDQFPQATITLEERLPEPNRIADIFVVHAGGQRWAIELQCAPLDVDEWRHRHEAYRKAGIVDIWIVGDNRREKQEAFIEAIIATAHELLFLDPQVTPPRIWLRWPVAQNTAGEWQHDKPFTLSFEGWVGRSGRNSSSAYGATLTGYLHEISLDEYTRLVHPTRTVLEKRTRLLRLMREATDLDVSLLVDYLRQRLDGEVVHMVVIPLLRAYLRDPELLRRYNYGRGLPGHPVSESDVLRVSKARMWLNTLEQCGFPHTRIDKITKELPFVGPYAAFAGYVETFLTLA